MAHQTWVASDLAPSTAYEFMTRLVVPRPIAFVSTVSRAGIRNLAPFSYFMLGGLKPLSLAFCPVFGEAGQPKDSLRNILETGEFVVNLVDRTISEEMNRTAFQFPHDVDEWTISGLRPVPSQLVAPPSVEESPASFECRLHQVVEHGQGPQASAYVIGEVVVIRIREDLINEGQIGRHCPIARLGGREYLDLDGGKVFELARPVATEPTSGD